MAKSSRFAGVARRVDLHCHSNASNEASESLLERIQCPESFSTPEQIYAQAKRRGMDFVTITDHDAIKGVMTIAGRANVLVGEEVTCLFPEDRCKIHVLVYGITAEHHTQLQARASNIYEVARYVAQQRLAHSVAHPLYRNNDKAECWHIEKLLLMFKGFEAINGAHSGLHRDAFGEVLDNLSPEQIEHLAQRYSMSPLWPDPHIKARTGGSDDHGLLNIGKTWTEFPSHVSTPADILEALRTGNCKAGGSEGAGIKLAHQFYSVAIRYYTRSVLPAGQTPSLPTILLQTFIGESPVTGKRELMKLAIKHKLKGIGKKLLKPWKRKDAVGGAGKILGKSFLSSAKARIQQYPELVDTIREGDAALSNHRAMFEFAGDVNRDVTRAIADEIEAAAEEGRFAGIFDAIAAAMAQQLVCLPYYFAFFHQNKERHLLRGMIGRPDARKPGRIRVGMFTDTLDEVNGVSRFIRDISRRAEQRGFDFTVHTCAEDVREVLPNRRNFQPVKAFRLPYYAELPLNIPPVLEILEWADRQQFDAIEVSTPGPMGLMGMLVAQMLRIPLLATYHTDFPAYVYTYSGDDRLTDATTAYMKWFYGHCDRVFTRSRPYGASLKSLGIGSEKIVTVLPGLDVESFNPRFRSQSIWEEHGVKQKYKVIYCGRVSGEKNLGLLEDAFARLAARRDDVALVVVGDGPYRAQMQKNLKSLPAYFLGYRFDEELSRLYASADLCAFPSRTDTLGQVVGEAQASGLPVLVSDEGGPKEMMDHGVSGYVLSGADPAMWERAIDELLNDQDRRLQMARNAATRATRFSMDRMFDAFWLAHADCVLPAQAAGPTGAGVAANVPQAAYLGEAR